MRSAHVEEQQVTSLHRGGEAQTVMLLTGTHPAVSLNIKNNTEGAVTEKTGSDGKRTLSSLLISTHWIHSLSLV